MAEPLPCAPEPCGSCPYRRDHPAGVWDAAEYRKLAEYDQESFPEAPLAVFLCHQTNATGQDTLCRGWLAVHPDCLAVRIALIQGRLADQDRYHVPQADLHPSGTAACQAGLAEIDSPGPAAERMQARLVRKGAGRPKDAEPRTGREKAAWINRLCRDRANVVYFQPDLGQSLIKRISRARYQNRTIQVELSFLHRWVDCPGLEHIQKFDRHF